MRCQIVESYRNYKPPFPVVPIVEDLVKCVPEKYLRGLDAIVLTNAGGQSRRARRRTTRARGRKVWVSTSRGFYKPPYAGRKPYIQLHVDLICGPTLKRRWWLAPLAAPFARRWRFAHVLYHELGHHIHRTQRPEHRERENVADGYMHALLKRLYVRRWYLGLAAFVAVLLNFAHSVLALQLVALLATHRGRGRRPAARHGQWRTVAGSSP